MFQLRPWLLFIGRMAIKTNLDPEKEAQDLLNATWAKGSLETPLPVDPNLIADRLGIKVFTAGLNEGVSGILWKRAGRDPEIHLQMSDSSNRRRFTCAHELGHYVAKAASDGGDNWEYVEHRALLASQGSDPDEIFANEFAANLLMPRADVERLRRRHQSPATLAAIFGVSEDAMNFRLVNLQRK